MLTGLDLYTFGITWLLAFVLHPVIQKARGVTYRFEKWIGFRKTIFLGTIHVNNGQRVEAESNISAASYLDINFTVMWLWCIWYLKEINILTFKLERNGVNVRLYYTCRIFTCRMWNRFLWFPWFWTTEKGFVKLTFSDSECATGGLKTE